MKYFYSILYLLAMVTVILSGCDSGGGNSSSGTSPAASSSSTQTTVTLDAFSDFSCTSNWTNRDGALGLVAYSGSGTCKATFPGESGTYRITLTVQTEFDGQSPYNISINGTVVNSGIYPLSSSLGCDCPIETWRSDCPDKNVDIDAGVHLINKGDVIEFYGEEMFACSDHGAYAKWHRMTFSPTM